MSYIKCCLSKMQLGSVSLKATWDMYSHFPLYWQHYRTFFTITVLPLNLYSFHLLPHKVEVVFCLALSWFQKGLCVLPTNSPPVMLWAVLPGVFMFYWKLESQHNAISCNIKPKAHIYGKAIFTATQLLNHLSQFTVDWAMCYVWDDVEIILLQFVCQWSDASKLDPY